jgi:cation diffusion facilitator family transporter
MPSDFALSRGRRLALFSVLASAGLAAMNVAVGLAAGSMSVVAIGVEFAGDVLGSTVVFVGLLVASRPPDDNHPYGHGRIETVAGLFVGFVLMAGGAGIVWRSIADVGFQGEAPEWPALVVLVLAIAVRSVMAAQKFRVARQIGSLALRSDAWNDAVDILSAGVALLAVALSRAFPDRLLAADHYGAVVVGLIVAGTGVRIVRSATMDLADTMPDRGMIEAVRRIALSVPGVDAVEKQYARKTGLRYHIDLHVEVAPDMTVRESHRIAHEVQASVLQQLAWVAGVLVHVEPAGGVSADGGFAPDSSTS